MMQFIRGAHWEKWEVMTGMKIPALSYVILIGLLFGTVVFANATHISTYVGTGKDVVPPIKDYDPFADVNGNESLGYPDGKIDIRDIAYVASKFGTTGNSTRNVSVIGMESGLCNGQPAGVYKEVVIVNALDWTAVDKGGTGDRGITIYQDDPSYRCLLPYEFDPKGELLNVSDMWILTTETCHWVHSYKFDIVFNNNITITTTSMAFFEVYYPNLRTTQITNSTIHQLLKPGINTVEFRNVLGGGTLERLIALHRVTILIEYYYQI